MTKTTRKISITINLKECYEEVTALQCFLCGEIFAADDKILKHLQQGHTDKELAEWETS